MAESKQQLTLFEQAGLRFAHLTELDWPLAERFPLNLPGQRKVEEQLLDDIARSRQPLIIAGYGSLERVVHLAGHVSEHCEKIRLLFGSEPTASGRDRDDRLDFEAVADALEGIEPVPPPDERVVACIVGVAPSGADAVADAGGMVGRARA